MSLTVKEMIEQNNVKRELLTPENEEYYSNLMVYIRTNANKDEKACEEVLLEMLDHLIEAQQDGKSAEEIFGKSPKELGDEVTRSLPKEPISKQLEFVAEIILSLFGWAMIPWGIVTLIRKEDVTLSLGKVGGTVILSIIAFSLIMYIILSSVKKSTYKPLKKIHYVFTFVFSVIIFGGVILFITQVKGFGPLIHMSYYSIFGLGCFLLLASHILKKSREAK